MVVIDARTQQVLVDQLFSAVKCVRLVGMSERSYDLLTKILRPVPKRTGGELQDVLDDEFMRLSEDNVSEFQKKEASGALPTDFPTMDEKDDVHRIMMEVEPLLGASRYRTRRKMLMTYGEYPFRRRYGIPNAGIWCCVGRGGVLLHGVAQPKSTGVNRGG